MKKLIEDYKLRVKNIYEFLDGCQGQPTNVAMIRAKERAGTYWIVIQELEKIEKQQNKLSKTGAGLIAIERQEQIEKHGITIHSDKDLNRSEQLRLAAIRLIIDSYDRDCLVPNNWDKRLWEKMASKPYLQRLIISGALLAAEIDRYQSIE